MEKKYLLGIDNGGTSLKAGLYDLEGKEIATANHSVTQIMPHDGWLERSLDEVWEANCIIIRKAIEKAGIDPADILGVAATGYANGAVFVGEDLESVMPNCILSGDLRAKDYIKKWYSDGTIEKNNVTTGQSLWAGQPVALAAWMKDNRPDLLEKTKYIMSITDYLRLKLSGTPMADVSNASTISSMNLYTKYWDKEVFENIGLADCLEKMPAEIVNSAEAKCYVSAKAAAETGLKEGTPVMGGMADITACALATGITDPDTLCLILGTWGINEAICPQVIADPNFFMTSLYPIDGYYLHTEGSTTSASNLQWFVDNFMGEEKAAMEAEGKNVYDACEEMIASVPYDDSTIVFMPFLYGTNANLDAKSCFIGLNGRHDKRYMLRAVYEGIMFSHMYHIEKLCKYRGTEFKKARISGGGAGSATWVQMFSDALQIPIEVPAAKELGCLGTAMCAAIGSKAVASFEEASNTFSKIKKTYQPNPERAAYYQTKYAIYKKLLEALDGVWGEFAKIEK